MKQVITVQEVKDVLNKIHAGGKKVVVAGGCFDILHIGHISLLENAKKQANVLVVLLESDSSIRQKKGIDRPIHTQQQRAQLVGALSAVDIVVLLPEHMENNDYDSLLREISPSIIATTENDPFLEHKKRQAALVGATVAAVNKYIPSVSTTKLLAILVKEL